MPLTATRSTISPSCGAGQLRRPDFARTLYLGSERLRCRGFEAPACAFNADCRCRYPDGMSATDIRRLRSTAGP